MSAELSILYRDEHFIAIDKPAGLLVHRSWISSDTEFAMQRLRDQIGQWVYPVHRLDRATSGLLLFALSPESAAAIGGVFEAGGVAKRYLTVVRGYTEEAGSVDYALREDKDKPEQAAVTHYRRLATVELPIPVGRYATARYSLVEVVPETGRMHQIRKHFAHIFHPLVGDTTYGEGRHNRLFREHFDCNRLLLMAAGIRFVHPYSGLETIIEAPLPADVAALLQGFGWAEWA